jgi:hypothetical protein
MDHSVADVCSRKRLAATASPENTALTSDLSDWRFDDAVGCISGAAAFSAEGLSRLASKAPGAAPLCTDRMRDHMIPAPTNSRNTPNDTLNRRVDTRPGAVWRRQLCRQSGDIMNRACIMNYDDEFADTTHLVTGRFAPCSPAGRMRQGTAGNTYSRTTWEFDIDRVACLQRAGIHLMTRRHFNCSACVRRPSQPAIGVA